MKLMEPKHRPGIDLHQAHSLGIRFCAERNARKLSIPEVADALLLSKQQVVGLEIGDLKSFYGAKLYAQAADKYAVFLAFAEKPSATLLLSCNADTVTVDALEASTKNASASMAQPEAVVATSGETIDISTPASVNAVPRRNRMMNRFVLVTALIAVAGIVVYTQPTRPGAVSTQQPPSPPAQANEVAQPATLTQQTREQTPAPIESPSEKPEVAASSADDVKNVVPDGRIELTFSGASWVQAVDKNGSKQEKMYHNGDRLELNPGQLQALIIGNSNAVSINTAKGKIDLKPYIGQGSQVARIIGPDIRQLSK